MPCYTTARNLDWDSSLKQTELQSTYFDNSCEISYKTTKSFTCNKRILKFFLIHAPLLFLNLRIGMLFIFELVMIGLWLGSFWKGLEWVPKRIQVWDPWFRQKSLDCTFIQKLLTVPSNYHYVNYGIWSRTLTRKLF